MYKVMLDQNKSIKKTRRKNLRDFYVMKHIKSIAAEKENKKKEYCNTFMYSHKLSFLFVFCIFYFAVILCYNSIISLKTPLKHSKYTIKKGNHIYKYLHKLNSKSQKEK